MKETIKNKLLRFTPRPITRTILEIREYTRRGKRRIFFKKLFKKYADFTMIKPETFVSNLELAALFSKVPGCVVECGVWRGGMSAALAEVLGKEREYFLFDSFEGLPEVSEKDGERASKWQKDKSGSDYFDNCTAEIAIAENAMRLSETPTYTLNKGWFKDTLPKFSLKEPIAVLRLDGDWYDSTMECLTYLFKHVEKGGVIIFDDYFVWEGCTKAVHDFLSKNQRAESVHQFRDKKIAYIIKQ